MSAPTHDQVADLKGRHPALRLLAAGNAPLIISFLARVFVDAGRRAVPWNALVAELDDELLALRRALGDDAYPASAAKYLNDWADPDNAWIRRYLPATGDEPLVDITPATEMLIEWLAGFDRGQFVGTESRLLGLIEQLRELVRGSEPDAAARLADLQARREALDAEIARVSAGDFDALDTRQVAERLQQAGDNARRLLRDFRQVEDNFRGLDRATRERIAGGGGDAAGRGRVLDDIFSAHGAIRESDQGRSFRAFWELLLSTGAKAELHALIERAGQLTPAPASGLETLLVDLQSAGGTVNQTLARLNEQLRRFLDDRRLDENRRISALIHGIEQAAVAVNEHPPSAGDFAHLPSLRADIDTTASRGLFMPPRPVSLDADIVDAAQDDIALDKLFDQVYVDERPLRAALDTALESAAQVSLTDLLAAHPPTLGLAELVAWVRIAHTDGRGVVDDDRHERVDLPADGARRARAVRLPRIVFAR